MNDSDRMSFGAPRRKQEWFFESSKIEVNRNRKFSNFKCILYIALKFIFRIFIPPPPTRMNFFFRSVVGRPTGRRAPQTGRQRPTRTRPLPPPHPGGAADPAPGGAAPRRPGAPADRRPGGSAPPANRRPGGSAPPANRRLGGSAPRRHKKKRRPQAPLFSVSKATTKKAAASEQGSVAAPSGTARQTRRPTESNPAFSCGH